LTIKSTLGCSSDLAIREVSIGENGQTSAAILYMDGLINKDDIQEYILKPLLAEARNDKKYLDFAFKQDWIHFLKELLTIRQLHEIRDFSALYDALLSGDTIILVDGELRGVVVSTKGGESRSVSEPITETVIRGPQEAFTESLRTNTALIRRRIKDTELWMETKHIGRRTKTEVAIMYMKGIARDGVVEEVRSRLDKIDIDGILGSGNIEEYIQDKTFTVFPTVFNSERPDVIAAGLLEGRVAIIVDGTPFVLLVPVLFIHFLHSSEDYYLRSDFGLIRILRTITIFISLLVPSIYIALTTFHQEMIPTDLLISIASQREGIPFPAFIEALMMEIAFEILRETGVRMPKPVGGAISTVGGLVLGQAAVEAGLVSAAMVIVVSITAIASFTLPAFTMSIPIRILRFAMMGLGASLGLFGIVMGLFVVSLHLCSLRSFGAPYMSPFAPINLADQKDSLFRLPLWMLNSRPQFSNPQNKVRQTTLAGKNRLSKGE